MTRMRSQTGVMTGNIVVGHGGGVSLSSSSAAGPDPETASTVVSGAGTATSDGTYLRDGESGGKAAYSLNLNTITWNGFAWNLADSTLGGVSYTSADDVDYPWLAVWLTEDGSLPVPVVTIG